MKSLEYSYKGGRINSAIYRLGSILNIKPILTCSKEGYYTIAKKVGRGKASHDRGVVGREGQTISTACALPFAAPATSKVRSLLETRLRSQVRAEILGAFRLACHPDLISTRAPGQAVGVRARTQAEAKPQAANLN